jgi:plasmid replication initiation protein
MLTLEQIRKALQDRRLDKVSKATGLHVNTIRNLRDRTDLNPSYKVYDAICKYLKDREIK